MSLRMRLYQPCRWLVATTLLILSTAIHAQSATATSGTQIVVNLGPPAAWASQAEIYRNYALVATVSRSTTSWTDNGLANGTTYSYYIRWMWWGECCWESSNTALFYATTWSAPAAPSGLGATLASATQFNLAWTDTSGNESGFKIERKTGSGGTYAQIGTTGINVASFSDPTVTAGVTYYYRVRATNAVGNSAYSAEAAAVPALPSAPISLNAAAFGQTQVNLTWEDVGNNETGYKVERKTGSGGTYAQVGTTGPNATYYIDSTGIAAGNTYFYRVRATNNAGDSGYTNEALAAVTTPAYGGNSYPDVQTRTSAFAYDPASGLLIREVIEPDNSALCVVTTYQYDAYGNKVSTTTRNCNGTSSGGLSEAAAPTGNAVFEPRTNVTTYASGSVTIGGTTYNWPAGQFPTSSTNALGHQESRTFDPRFGLLVSLTGPNSLTTAWTYDGFGRKSQESRADGTSTTWTYTLCGSCPSGGKYSVTVAGTGAPTSTAYFDLLNRTFRSEVQGFDGTLVRKDTEFDPLGRVWRESRPYYATSAPSWTTLTYDILGRVLTQTEANGAVTTFAYDGLATTATNALNQSEVKVKNSQGQLIRVIKQ